MNVMVVVETTDGVYRQFFSLVYRMQKWVLFSWRLAQRYMLDASVITQRITSEGYSVVIECRCRGVVADINDRYQKLVLAFVRSVPAEARSVIVFEVRVLDSSGPRKRVQTQAHGDYSI